jgi:nucleotidyltransferase substrate binding protein (TIGR01987 family)
MNKVVWHDSFKDLNRAIERLRDAYEKALVNTKEHEFYRDSVIKRFEFTYELFWKTLKKFLLHEGIEANIPREVLSKSYMAGLIDQDKIWLEMIDDRNLTSHTYKEAFAREIFVRISIYLQLFEKTYMNLEKRYEQV